MNDIEDRLRTDLHAAVEAAAPALPERTGVAMTVARRRRRRHATFVGAAAGFAFVLGVVASRATADDQDDDPFIDDPTTVPVPPTATSTTTSTSTSTSTSTILPTSSVPPPLATDALLGVPFGEDPDDAIDQVLQASGGTLASDTTQRAADIGSTGFPCHGPNGPMVQELRSAVIEGDRVTLRLYIADGVFMGYEVSGSATAYVTPEGVGLGSRETDLRSAYGDRLSIAPGISDPQFWATVEISGTTLPLTFTYNDGAPVNQVTVGGRCAD